MISSFKIFKEYLKDTS